MRGRVKGKGAALSLVTVGVAAVVLLVAISVPLLFLQFRSVDVREEKTIASIAGAEHLRLNVKATVGLLRVEFLDLPGRAAVVVAEVKGHAGYFGEASPARLDMAVATDVPDGGSNISAAVVFDTYAPWPYYSLSETYYTVQINRSLRADLNLSVQTGGVVLTTAPGVVLDGLRLNATNEGAAVTLSNGTILAGDVHIRTATGGTTFVWENVETRGDRTVTLSESSGFIRASFVQTVPLGSNVTVMCKDTAGTVNTSLSLAGDASANVVAHGGIGGVALKPIAGFSGDALSFRSDNYPGAGRFDIRLNNTLGAIGVEGSWVPHTS